MTGNDEFRFCLYIPTLFFSLYEYPYDYAMHVKEKWISNHK